MRRGSTICVPIPTRRASSTSSSHPPEDRHRAFAEAYDFSGARLIADVGGGNGEALRRVLARAPSARGIIFDRKDVVDAVPKDKLLDGRITVEAGDFFSRVPQGADIYLLNWVMHDWPDDDCVRILTSCRAAMAPDARLLIGELILNPDPEAGHPTSYLLDVHMMAMFATARERTEAEYRDLLARAGFAFERAIPTASLFSVIEAVPR
ncbi:MAG: hypothetical protein A4S14_02100 [Proteobacteria bacterium SG_bin9]|nr:MAG: hypothetical protein A4S14_02100 [Proteobacteria bacterium SG_bin9]